MNYGKFFWPRIKWIILLKVLTFKQQFHYLNIVHTWIISVHQQINGIYSIQANIEFDAEWICNPAKLDFLPNPHGSRVEDRRHERWLNFLNDTSNIWLARRLMRNEYSFDKCQKMKIIHGLEFDTEMMKGIDKVEQDFLPKIQEFTEMKETYDRFKLKEIFELQRNKNLVDDERSDPEMSWLPGTTFDEKFDHFMQKKKDENFLEILDKIPRGKFDHSYIYCMKNNMIIYSRQSIS